MTKKRAGEKERALSYDAIVAALFETYESIYDIDAETSAYQCYHESDAYQGLHVARSGGDFFAALRKHVKQVICPEDQAYVLRMLEKDNLLAALKKEGRYSFVYRLISKGEPVYHQIRATIEPVNGRPHVLMGIRNVDEMFRQNKAHGEEIALMHQKEKNHMEAILASAAGYFEANLTQDLVLDMALYLAKDDEALRKELTAGGQLKFSELERWRYENSVVANRAKYARISNREYLISCFERGERRSSVEFSARTLKGEDQPCRKMFYLYQDNATGDIMAFCVVYDLTEQQKKEQELEKLENELRMSRIRNSTSQMQPHFLYNALGSIQEVLLEDPQYASELIEDFTIHLRSCIRAMNSDAPLPFSMELDNIRAYVNIERMRFGERLKVRYEIEADDFLIVPLSIQPLVENAIRHGIYQRGAAGGTVVLRTRDAGDAWRVEVEDNGVGFDICAYRRETESGKRDSTGLKNIIFRLDKVMHADVDIASTVGSGTKVTVTIPKGGNKA
ncbi:MAG: histidine kinase [Clostridia bacterium]|nr:histidine kinase [Clostridia bacterium]